MKQNSNTERRRHRRLDATAGAMVFLDGVKIFGQIKDICMGGLAFEHTKSEKSFEDYFSEKHSGSIEILCGKKDFSMGNVKVNIISNVKTARNSTSLGVITKSRCSLKFECLTNDQIFLIKRFLLICTDCEDC